MSARYDGRGVALHNEASEILRVTEVSGPVALVVHNESEDNEVVLSCEDESDGSLVAMDEDTAVTAEDTGYDGDASTLAFSGESLDNVPIIPKSVTVKPTAGGNSVNAVDRDGDGVLYTDDDDEDECGSIDYFTGALVLNYPTGKDPAATNITADYTYQDATTVPLGTKNLRIGSNPPSKNLVVKAASEAASGSIVSVDALISF